MIATRRGRVHVGTAASAVQPGEAGGSHGQQNPVELRST